MESAGNDPVERSANLSLRATARIHQVDRRLRTIAFARMFGRWIGLPAFVVAALLLGYLLITRPVGTDPAVWIPLAIASVAVVVFMSSSRQLGAEEEKLRKERADLESHKPGSLPLRFQDPERDSSSA